MELTINVQVGVSPEVAELVRKAVAMIMSGKAAGGRTRKGRTCLAARGR